MRKQKTKPGPAKLVQVSHLEPTYLPQHAALADRRILQISRKVKSLARTCTGFTEKQDTPTPSGEAVHVFQMSCVR